MSEGGGNAGKGCILVVFLVLAMGMIGAGVLVTWFAMPQSGPEVAGPATPSEPAHVSSEGPVVPVAPRAKMGALKRIQDRGVLLVAMDSGEPPFTGTPPMYVPSETGDPDGFDTALARQIAVAAGVSDIKVVHAKYSGLEDLLLDPTPKVDVLISGYVPTDTDGIAWSESYLEFGLCLVVPAKSKVRTVADLFGQPIGIFDDDAAAEEVGRLVKGYTEMVRLEDGYWDQLASGRFAGFLYDYPYAAAEIEAWYVQNPSRAGSLRIAQYNLTDSTYNVGVRAGEQDLLGVVNQAVKSWRDSDAYGEAVKRWLKGGKAVEATVPAGKRVVKVEKGDTLSLIAKRELGSVDRWPDLWDLNRERFPNPHLIDVGDEVVLP
ncbi:MAG: transporter substrate-binding domain-containing protein [Myxococcales bacterium]|nr:transporter substrate-binding domain-containing protein [Myxococcales bacterium]